MAQKKRVYFTVEAPGADERSGSGQFQRLGGSPSQGTEGWGLEDLDYP